MADRLRFAGSVGIDQELGGGELDRAVQHRELGIAVGVEEVESSFLVHRDARAQHRVS
jgi:hypothetical protein